MSGCMVQCCNTRSLVFPDRVRMSLSALGIHPKINYQRKIKFFLSCVLKYKYKIREKLMQNFSRFGTLPAIFSGANGLSQKFETLSRYAVYHYKHINKSYVISKKILIASQKRFRFIADFLHFCTGNFEARNTQNIFLRLEKQIFQHQNKHLTLVVLELCITTISYYLKGYISEIWHKYILIALI